MAAAWEKSSKIWTDQLTQKFGDVKASVLAGQVQKRYGELAAGRPYFKQRALRQHLENHILPGLALYQVLKEDLRDQAAALAVVDDLFAAAMAESPECKQLMLMARLPDPFSWMSLASRLQISMAYPKEGWTMKTVVNTRDVLGFDTTHCIYIDVLNSYHAPELAPSFCANDDYLMKDIPFARFEHTMTLGQGDPVCNFRYYRI